MTKIDGFEITLSSYWLEPDTESYNQIPLYFEEWTISQTTESINWDAIEAEAVRSISVMFKKIKAKHLRKEANGKNQKVLG